MRCQVQLVIIKQLEHSKGQIKSYVPKSNIVQVKNFQNVPLYRISIGKFAGSFLQQHCHVEFLFKFLDKSVNFFITFCFQKFVDNHQQCFALPLQVNFPANDLNFHWRWRWWKLVQAIFLNLFYFTSEQKSTLCGWPGNQSEGREIRNVLRTIHFASTEISRNVMDVAYFWGYTYIFDVKERFDNIAITKCRKSCSFPNSFITIHKIIFMYQIQIT